MHGNTTTDTPRHVEEVLIEGYRRMSPAEKLMRVSELNKTVQQLALADIRRRYPLADSRERALRLASRWIEPDLMRTIFDWDPDTVGY